MGFQESIVSVIHIKYVWGYHVVSKDRVRGQGEGAGDRGEGRGEGEERGGGDRREGEGVGEGRGGGEIYRMIITQSSLALC